MEKEKFMKNITTVKRGCVGFKCKSLALIGTAETGTIRNGKGV